LVTWCAAALAAPLVFHCFIAGVALGFYWTLWVAPLFALAALGIDAVVRRVQAIPAPTSAGAWIVPIVATAALVVPAGAALAESHRVATVKPEGAAALAGVRHAHGLDGRVLTTGVALFQLFRYIPPSTFLVARSQPLAGTDTVIVGATQCRNLADNRGVRAIVAVNLQAGRLQRLHRDSLATIYEVTRPLVKPTDAQVAAQPPTDLTAGC
jgi:hypothetical protein